ncbi:hypothetical protein CBS101457_001726 [Exobasidium rhododendri]|nr:hypothetical protein CBS101457_001726 [Exobasidium rhododendri]
MQQSPYLASESGAGPESQAGNGNGQQLGNQGQLDSISLGQLRNLVNNHRPKSRQYSYPSDADSDTLMKEIDEFYSYVEAPQVTENRAAWEEWCTLASKGEVIPSSNKNDKMKTEGASFSGGALGLGLEESFASETGQSEEESNVANWTNLPTSARRKRIQALLSLLEVKDPVARQRASRALLYLLQGSFAETKGAEHQLIWVTENARMVRGAGGLGEIYSAFKIASWKHDWLSSLPDHITSSDPVKEGESAPEPLLTWQAKLEYLDEINLELALHFAQLYILVETQRGEDEWGDELMSLDPPLPIYLFNLVAALREKNAKGYPVKKLLLLLWKSILACFGGIKEAARCKDLARELEGLAKTADESSREGRDSRPIVTKTSPLDLQTYQDEISVKYPTYSAPKKRMGELPVEKIASAVSPIPIRRSLGGQGNDKGGMDGSSNYPATPAPSPPPSPKQNKQKYQTDQTRPFVFPYSRSVQGSRTVPFSIDEADRLYRDNMHVSLEMWQLWRLREECIHEESGVASAADGTRIGIVALSDREMKKMSFHHQSQNVGDGRGAGGSSSQGSRSPSNTDGPSSTSGRTAFQQSKTRGEPTLDRLQLLEQELEAERIRTESDHMLAVLDNERYISQLASLQQKREDAKKLQRVDILYKAVLPCLQNSIIVLLKLLLATVTQQNISSNSPHFQALAEGISIEDAPPPTLEDIDIVRHREITSKSISGIIFLLLKWFKNSHIMKFNFLSQLLVDSNCLLLILKMFGLTELCTQVKVINEIPNFNFFKFCELNCGKEVRKPNAEDTVLARQPFEGIESPPAGLAHLNSSVEKDEIEHLDQYSFRNFYSGLNFTRILQKLTKKKVHRILLLVQYKSSAILKRTLKVPHPMLKLYALKIIKSQVPFCGRKWRQSNMKVITAIYLNCRPDLRDEWLSGADVDGDVEESLPQEQALRGLIKYYNSTRIGSVGSISTSQAGVAGGHAHKRSLSTGGVGSLVSQQLNEGGGSLVGADNENGTGAMASNSSNNNNNNNNNNMNGAPHLAPSLSPTSLIRSNSSNFFESDTLPPLRRGSESTAGTMRYIPDDLLEGYLDDYEDILGEVFGESNSQMNGEESQAVAWARLGEILGQAESISDSESIATMGELNFEGDESNKESYHGTFSQEQRNQSNEDGESTEGAQTWESLSPQAMKYLTSSRPSTPGSPRVDRHSRRTSDSASSSSSSSSSSSLSPSLPSDGLLHHSSSRRSGSDSSPLRPVLSFGPELLNDENEEAEEILLGNNAILEDELDNDEEEEGEGGQFGQDEAALPKPKAGGIDEVEHVWNL